MGPFGTVLLIIFLLLLGATWIGWIGASIHFLGAAALIVGAVALIELFFSPVRRWFSARR
jgi:hypothetical protein